tara:strand:- start:120 stop:482 length:363 start_codon:yes stop_codon:yes gene_type:complete
MFFMSDSNSFPIDTLDDAALKILLTEFFEVTWPNLDAVLTALFVLHKDKMSREHQAVLFGVLGTYVKEMNNALSHYNLEVLESHGHAMQQVLHNPIINHIIQDTLKSAVNLGVHQILERK